MSITTASFTFDRSGAQSVVVLDAATETPTVVIDRVGSWVLSGTPRQHAWGVTLDGVLGKRPIFRVGNYNVSNGFRIPFGGSEAVRASLFANTYFCGWQPDPHDVMGWQNVPSTARNLETGYGDFEVQDPLPVNTIYAASDPIYTLERYRRILSKVASHPYAAPLPTPGRGLSLVRWPGGEAVGRGHVAPANGYAIGLAKNGYGYGSKNLAVISSGVHPWEMTAAVAWESMVNWLISGDPEAEELLDWCDFYIFGGVTTSGIASGYFRSFPGEENRDSNRTWFDASSTDRAQWQFYVRDLMNQRPCNFACDFHAGTSEAFSRMTFLNNTELDPLYPPFKAFCDTRAAAFGQLVSSSFGTSITDNFSSFVRAINTAPVNLRVTYENPSGPLWGIQRCANDGLIIGRALRDFVIDGNLEFGP